MRRMNEVVDAVLAPSGDDVVALVELFHEGGNVVGIVLKIAVHGEDELAGGVVETGGERRGLAEVPAQLDHEDAAVDRGDLFEQFVGAVPGAVVNKHHLKAVGHLFHYLLQAGVQYGDVFFLIVKRNDDGEFRHGIGLDAVFVIQDYSLSRKCFVRIADAGGCPYGNLRSAICDNLLRSINAPCKEWNSSSQMKPPDAPCMKVLAPVLNMPSRVLSLR